MQIEDGSIVKFLSAVLGVVATTLTGLYWYIWRGDRARLKTLEDKMLNAVTMPQVEHIVERVEKNFKEEHNTIMQGQKTILDVIDNRNNEMREYIRDMLDNRKERWNGSNRRKN